MADTRFVPLGATVLSERVYLLLRKEILERRLAPGDQVLVDDLARQLGVSRTPVKEALNRLAIEGLVDKVARHGTFVTRPNPRHVAEVFEARLLVESWGAERIMETGRTPALLQVMRDCMMHMAEAVDGDEYRDFDDFMRWDSALHLALIRLAGNAVLLKLYQDLNVHIEISRAHYLQTVTPPAQPLREHRAIFEALESGNKDRVRDALAAHIENVKALALSSLAREQSPAPAPSGQL